MTANRLVRLPLRYIYTLSIVCTSGSWKTIIVNWPAGDKGCTISYLSSTGPWFAFHIAHPCLSPSWLKKIYTHRIWVVIDLISVHDLILLHCQVFHLKQTFVIIILCSSIPVLEGFNGRVLTHAANSLVGQLFLCAICRHLAPRHFIHSVKVSLTCWIAPFLLFYIQ